MDVITFLIGIIGILLGVFFLLGDIRETREVEKMGNIEEISTIPFSFGVQVAIDILLFILGAVCIVLSIL